MTIGKKSIGKDILAARNQAGLSLRDVSAATGGQVSAGALSLIERGLRYPSLASLEALAEALGVVITIAADGVTVKRR